MTTSEFISMLKPVTPDAIVTGLTTLIGSLVGALVGAMLAYFLQRRYQRLQEHKLNLIMGHRLMFVLLQQINTVILIQRDYIYKHLQDRGRFTAIPATALFDLKKNVLDPSELSFLLEDKKARNLLYDFYIAQESYIEALNQWNLRSSFHLEKLQPALAASGLLNGGVVTDTVMRCALGDQIYGTAISATDNCIKALQLAFQKLVKAKLAIRPHLVQRFKSNDFADFDFPETWGLSQNEQPSTQSSIS
jgi:hypothetical protein